MTEAKRDNNRIPVALGVLDSDGATPTPIKANSTSHILMVDDNNTGSDNSSNNEAQRDNNQITTLIAVSGSDGTTPVQLYVDSSGNLLIDSH